MRDPIEELKTGLAQQPFQNAAFNALITTRLESLDQARQAMLGSMNRQEVAAYQAQRLQAWQVAQDNNLMPHYAADDPELVRYIDALHLIFADAELIPRGVKAFSLRSLLSGDIGHAFREGDVRHAAGTAPIDEDSVIQHLKDWQRTLAPMKAEIREGKGRTPQGS